MSERRQILPNGAIVDDPTRVTHLHETAFSKDTPHFPGKLSDVLTILRNQANGFVPPVEILARWRNIREWDLIADEYNRDFLFAGGHRNKEGKVDLMLASTTAVIYRKIDKDHSLQPTSVRISAVRRDSQGTPRIHVVKYSATTGKATKIGVMIKQKEMPLRRTDPSVIILSPANQVRFREPYITNMMLLSTTANDLESTGLLVGINKQGQGFVFEGSDSPQNNFGFTLSSERDDHVLSYQSPETGEKWQTKFSNNGAFSTT